MEKIALCAALLALPSVIFMLVANITGGNKTIAWVFIKFPSLVSLICMILIGLVYIGLLKLA